MSSNNISPIHDYRPGRGTPPVMASDHQRRLPSSPTPPPSPDNRNRPSTTAAPSPATGADRDPATGTPSTSVRPASGRSAMDLYAAIHESKKRLLGQQPAAAAVVVARSPTAAPVQTPRQQPTPTIRAAQTAVVRRPPERQSDRCRPRDDRSARYDFKRLLLQTNMAGGRRAQQSAVVRLQQPPPQRAALTGVRGGPAVTGSPSGRRGLLSSSMSSWKSNVLSSTIQEDCREDEHYDDFGTTGTGDGVPRSAALVNRTLKGLQTSVSSTCSALETAL